MKATGGFSPAALALAFLDWSIHLASAPGKRLGLADKAARKTNRLLTCYLDMRALVLLFHASSPSAQAG